MVMKCHHIHVHIITDSHWWAVNFPGQFSLAGRHKLVLYYQSSPLGATSVLNHWHHHHRRGRCRHHRHHQHHHYHHHQLYPQIISCFSFPLMMPKIKLSCMFANILLCKHDIMQNFIYNFKVFIPFAAIIYQNGPLKNGLQFRDVPWS